MDMNRRGEIALAIVKVIAHREGPERMLKHMGKLKLVAEATGIELDDLRTFFELLARELVKDWFSSK